MLSPVLILAREIESPGRAVIATDAQGTVIYWGVGARLLYGWTEAEALGRNIVDVTPGELSRAEAHEIMRTLMAGDPWSGEFVVCAKDGSRFGAHVTDVPVHDARGRLLGIVGISRRTGYLGAR